MNRASMKWILPVVDEAGKHSSVVPIAISSRNPSDNILGGVSLGLPKFKLANVILLTINDGKLLTRL
ncbi:hypothetical protein [Paenibacillus sp. GCM10012306]|uniref:hypothetical protein n=1 Tax=Paenibacillus sp. GCM10012306 TaxID=3317342 RepID=UPI00361408DD